MSPLSRMVARLLLHAFLAVSVLSIGNSVQADRIKNHLRSSSISNPYVGAAARPEVNSRRTITNSQMLARWLQFKSPRVSELGRAWINVSCDLRKTLNAQIRLYQSRIEQTVYVAVHDWSVSSVAPADWLSGWLHSEEPQHKNLAVARYGREDETLYWDYYGDCERWNVDLTRRVRQTRKVVVAKVQPSKESGVRDAETLTLQEAATADRLAIYLHRTSQWLGQVFKQIEFAKVESRLSSNAIDKTHLH